MTRTVLATILAAALGLATFGTAPARADEDVAKVLAGIATIFILSKALDNDDPPATRRYSYRPRAYDERGLINRHKAKRFYKVAPRRCLREQWTHRGVREVYAARCLRREARVAPPAKCRREARTNSGPRVFYTPRCLRKYGWRT
ncbi:MAG: hypothetical protein JXR14_15255 [Paracoccaceae bacterium]